ncbi:MAG: Ribonuclease Y [candidate division WS2 bacterium ADurb.Bin280]|uniref:Ribonuclease Y n=1 Tax=candidate division WS2 bacterium ADurb.Bin280 TaxID=1852829 RepID=A0A1V5SDU6_9BACT|nr:MAG: Ribonuclease Y [candidate division WS2 bacterium ADurb.Bin280]
MTSVIVSAAIALIAGVAAGFFYRQASLSKKLKENDTKHKELIIEAKDEALKIKEEAEKERQNKLKDISERERSLSRREENLESRLERYESAKTQIEEKQKSIETIKKEIEEIRLEKIKELEKVAKLKTTEARDQIIKEVERDYEADIVKKVREMKELLKENSEQEARKILSVAIGRMANEFTAEHTATSVQIPSEEMKGRIIGKEGRNIQAFERATGVDLIIDETPDTVLLSSFDPIRRHVAKVALERLISDGRIQPSRIEEVVAKVQQDVKKEAKEAGEKAVFDLGVHGLHGDLIKIIGNLKFRTSYGQNVLAHSMEVANIAALLAAEVGADVNIVKKAGILHDIGKAVSHEIQGSHHHLSAEIARKYGVSEDVIHAVLAHHDDVEAKTVEAILVKAADAISGSRPGARRETLENYVQRLKDLENIANSFEGVDKTFAIQAGREVRIIVKPEAVTDLEAIKLSKDIARKIEQDLQYPGMIKVNVIREVRSEEYAK